MSPPTVGAARRAARSATASALLIAAVLTTLVDATSAAATSSTKLKYARNRLIVKLKDGVVVANSESTLGVSYTRSLGSSSMGDLYSITDGSSVAAKVSQLSSMASVEYAEPDYLVSITDDVAWDGDQGHWRVRVDRRNAETGKIWGGLSIAEEGTLEEMGRAAEPAAADAGPQPIRSGSRRAAELGGAPAGRGKALNRRSLKGSSTTYDVQDSVVTIDTSYSSSTSSSPPPPSPSPSPSPVLAAASSASPTLEQDEVTPNDTLYSEQWHHPVISSPRAWARTTGSKAARVCVVDSGVQLDHPDLAANVAGGWNLVPEDQSGSGETPQPGSAAYANYNDTQGHGTHTAGIVAAVGDNARGVSGVNWELELYICKFIWDDGTGYISDALTCQNLCQSAGATITSNSWGGISYQTYLDTQLTNIVDAGTLFVGSAGNLGTNLDTAKTYPAAFNKAGQISVASTGTDDYLSTFSCYGGETVTLAAPGEAILSTLNTGSYGTMTGTSMACPMVAGAAAILQGVALERGVNLTNVELKAYIQSNVDVKLGLTGFVVSNGRLNVSKALEALLDDLDDISPPPPPPTNERADPDAYAASVSAASAEAPAPSADADGLGDSQSSNGTSSSRNLAEADPSGASGAEAAAAAAEAAAPGPAPAESSEVAVPTCGTTALRGKTASQSSSETHSPASAAVDGDCRSNVTALPVSCASTLRETDPWWALDAGEGRTWTAVWLKARSDCTNADGCWTDLEGARVLVGTQPWVSRAVSEDAFTLCGTVGAVTRGQRVEVECDSTVQGRYLAVALAADEAKLTLCEVDAAFA